MQRVAVFDVCHRPVFSESLLGFGVSSAKIMDHALLRAKRRGSCPVALSRSPTMCQQGAAWRKNPEGLGCPPVGEEEWEENGLVRLAGRPWRDVQTRPRVALQKFRPRACRETARPQRGTGRFARLRGRFRRRPAGAAPARRRAGGPRGEPELKICCVLRLLLCGSVALWLCGSVALWLCDPPTL